MRKENRKLKSDAELRSLLTEMLSGFYNDPPETPEDWDAVKDGLWIATSYAQKQAMLLRRAAKGNPSLEEKKDRK